AYLVSHWQHQSGALLDDARVRWQSRLYRLDGRHILRLRGPRPERWGSWVAALRRACDKLLQQLRVSWYHPLVGSRVNLSPVTCCTCVQNCSPVALGVSDPFSTPSTSISCAQCRDDGTPAPLVPLGSRCGCQRRLGRRVVM